MNLKIKPSATVELSRKISALKHSGANIIELNMGEPDFPTPDPIKSAAKKAIDLNYTHYTPVSGILELRKAICRKFQSENKLDYQPEEVIVTSGAKQALLLALMSLCDPGDEVIILTPCWVSFIEMVKIAGAVPVLVETNEKNEFQIDIKSLERALSNKTKALILNSPNNPTGAVYSKETLSSLAQMAIKNAFYLISDEIYENIVYEDARHHSIAAISPAGFSRTITVNGLSKAFAMTGWRIGYAAGPGDFIEKMCTIQGHMTTCSNSISQWAAIAALRESKNEAEEMRQAYEERKKYLMTRLLKIPLISCARIDGTFYAFPNVTQYLNKRYQDYHIKSTIDLADFILSEGQVALVPGDAFQAPGYLRMSFANSMVNIQTGCDRIENCLSLLK